jgi:hypothetical protein
MRCTHRLLLPTDAAENVKASLPAVHAGQGRGKTDDNGTRFSHGSSSASEIVHRLKRDHPDIADALARGEYKSARSIPTRPPEPSQFARGQQGEIDRSGKHNN